MKSINIIYWSGTGNTEMMAKAIEVGASEEGAEVKVKQVGEASLDDIKNPDVVVLGCPAMGAEVLEEAEMEPFIESISGEAQGKNIVLFGSYGWGDGECMRNWEDKMKELGANLIFDSLIINETPDDAAIDECKNLGRNLAK